jgi:hypothetical protein
VTRTTLRSALVICALVLCGCSQAPELSLPAAAPREFSILDEVAAKPEYSNSITQAQRDLPTDIWAEKPYRYNASRNERVWEVASRMLETVKPRFKSMSVSNLVNSLKVVPLPMGLLTNNFGEVVETFYAAGNRFILAEIKARPANELRGLRELGSEKVTLIEGPQGFGLPLTCDLEDILRGRGLTNGLSP